MAAKSNRRTRLYILVSVGLIVIFTAIFMFVQMRRAISDAGDSICKSSQYSGIQVGITKEQVVRLLGRPALERVKDNTDQNFFYQGIKETEIKEGWIYRADGQPDSAEIYFDNSELVNGKNCGQG